MVVLRPEMEFFSIPQFNNWTKDIEGLNDERTRTLTLTDLYKLSNHLKLIQHQYEIFTMIATSEYMCNKLKIETSYECSHCLEGTPET